MDINQHPEIYWAAASVVFTAMLWVPHILQRIIEMKPYEAFRDPRHDVPTKAPWAQRAIRAHTNAVENLAVFGILAILLVMTNSTTQATASAAALYFWLRFAHYFVYMFGVPWVRTPIFVAALCCQLLMAAQLFGAI